MWRLRIINLILGLFLVTEVFPQNASLNIPIYVRKGAYNSEVRQRLRDRWKMLEYDYLGNYFIDRNHKDVVDLKFVAEGLKRLYPSVQDSGMLCVDLENKLFKNLRDYEKDHVLFKKSSAEFIKLVGFIKSFRPNLKVGLYGIPMNFYWASQTRYNSNMKFLEILKHTDFISPHLYIHYQDSERTPQANIQYIKANLAIALSYGKALNKPVIPYFWYVIHPANKKHSRELLSFKQVATYLKAINNYELESAKVEGIIWWQPQKVSYKMAEDDLRRGTMGENAGGILEAYLKNLN